MSARTAPLHTPAELALASCDDVTGIVAFVVRSRHDATRVNTVSLDTQTGTIHCDCRGAECDKACWHADLVVAAWERTQAAHISRMLSPVALYNQSRKALTMVTIYRDRCGRALPDDVLTLVASRYEWRRRAAARLVPPTPEAPLGALPALALVA